MWVSANETAGLGMAGQVRKATESREGRRGGRTVFRLWPVGNPLWSADFGSWSTSLSEHEAPECVWNKCCFGDNSHGAKDRKGTQN